MSVRPARSASPTAPLQQREKTDETSLASKRTRPHRRRPQLSTTSEERAMRARANRRPRLHQPWLKHTVTSPKSTRVKKSTHGHPTGLFRWRPPSYDFSGAAITPRGAAQPPTHSPKPALDSARSYSLPHAWRPEITIGATSPARSRLLQGAGTTCNSTTRGACIQFGTSLVPMSISTLNILI